MKPAPPVMKMRLLVRAMNLRASFAPPEQGKKR